jgi:hypothetical protein
VSNTRRPTNTSQGSVIWQAQSDLSGLYVLPYMLIGMQFMTYIKSLNNVAPGCLAVPGKGRRTTFKALQEGTVARLLPLRSIIYPTWRGSPQAFERTASRFQ